MEYPFIKSLVPEGEHFDASAVGEGVWMSVKHFNETENTGSQLTANVVKLQSEVDAGKVNLDASIARVAALEASAATNATTISTQASRITALEAQITAHGAKSSGTGTGLTVKKDDGNESVKIPAYADDNSPENVWADKHMRKKKTA